MAQITTQSHLDIEDIRKDLVFLKSGSVALILETSSLNFELLSEPEQDARIDGFANLINSLTFPMQIVVHTERTDVTEYLEKLRGYQLKQSSQAIIKQVDIYMKFIKNLTYDNEILNKRFFVVIPAMLGAIEKPSFINTILGTQSKVEIDVDKVISKAQLDLYPKRDHLMRQFKKMGLSVKQLGTDELIHLFYSLYDPDKTGQKNDSISKDAYTNNMVVHGE